MIEVLGKLLSWCFIQREKTESLKQLEKMVESDNKHETQGESGSSSWFEQKTMPWWGSLAVQVLKQGKLPKHIAIILDGNRRFARRNNLSSVIEGHSRGFQQLTKVLDWCREFGVLEVTIYVFSIENFRRPNDEVQGLIMMAKEKLEKLLSECETLEQRSICVRFFGNRALLPRELQLLMAKIELLTISHNSAFLNICLAYTSQDEVARAMEWIRLGVRKRLIEPSDVDGWLVEKCLDTRLSYPVDMLIRTSEKRLSDFLLLQVESNCYLHFETSVLWPEFEFYHLAKALLYYQFDAVNTRSMEEIASMSINKLPSKNSTSLNGRAQEITESTYAEEQLVKVDVDKERRRTHFTDWVQEEHITLMERLVAEAESN